MNLVFVLGALFVALTWLVWRLGRPSRDAVMPETPPHRPPPELPPIEPPGDPELDAFLARQYRRRAYSFRTRLSSGQEIAVGYSLNEDWVDVLARRALAGERSPQGPYEQFGYHMRHHRWSFGAEPPGAAEIKAVLVSHLGDRTARRGSQQGPPDRAAHRRHTVPRASRRRVAPPS